MARKGPRGGCGRRRGSRSGCLRAPEGALVGRYAANATGGTPVLRFPRQRDGGNVLTMEDYHGNTTAYTYNDLGQLATLTAPGSKVWEYTYDTGNRLTRVDIPNGMHTAYTYDASGRQDSIHHMDSTTVVQGFDYTFDNGGNITRIDQEDGSYWEYDYDGRDRLTDAVRGNKATPTIEAVYAYTYDDGDNMLTKVTPWFDDFEDGNITGWSGDTGYFSVSGGVMANTSNASWRGIYLSESDADHDLRFDYVRYSATGTGQIILRFTDPNNLLYLEVNPTVIFLRQRDGGVLTTLDSYSTTVAEDTWYSVRAILDGANVNVWWGEVGGSFDEVLNTTSATETATSTAGYFRASPNSEHGFDNIQLVTDGRSTTQTFTYNDANEQITSTVNGVTTDMDYDDWGRLVERDDGTHTATYGYRYGSKLYSSASDFPGEGGVTYETGGDGKRRSRVAGADETWYNYTAGFDVISTEDDADGSSGNLTMTNVIRSPRTQVSATLADLDGTTPASGTARYYATDHLGSTRSVWNSSKVAVGAYEFTPYGSEYFHVGVALATLVGAYTGKPWDPTAKLFHFPYRQYSPDMARWTSRDPLGMVDGPNVYHYCQLNPLANLDPLGSLLTGWWGNTACEIGCMVAIELILLGAGGLGGGLGGIICAVEITAICALLCAPVGANPPGPGSPPPGDSPGPGFPPPPPPCKGGYVQVNWHGMCLCVKQDDRVGGPYSYGCGS